MTDKIHIAPAAADAKCAVHDLPDEGLAKFIVAEMRRLHGHGGLDICVDCLARAKAHLEEKRK